MTAVFPWGIVVGQQVSGYLTDINEKQEYRLRPPHQMPVIDRLRVAGLNV